MKKYLIIFFFAILTLNLLLIDFWVIHKMAESGFPVQVAVNPQCDFSCPQSCVSLVKEATSTGKVSDISMKNSAQEVTSAPKIYVTTIIQPTGSDQPIKEYVVNFGSSVWTSSDFQSVPGLVKSINLSNFGSIKKIYFEVVAHLSNENTSGAIRLYNNSDKKVVEGSEVKFNSVKCQPMTSVPINLEVYSKEYQIQVMSTENSTLYIDSARLRIITQ
jgi:hypothetical protein